MKISRLEIAELFMPLTEPYTIAYESIDHCVNIILRMEAENGIIGWGCAAPDLSVTGETPQSVKTAFDEVIHPYVKGRNALMGARHYDHLRKRLKGHPSALAMVDMALYDMVSKRAGLPLFQFLGGYRSSIRTSVTVGILPPDKTLKKVSEYVAQGFRIVKIKGGKDLHEDIAKINLIAERFQKKIEIRFDANQGYTVPEAVHFINQTKGSGLTLLEQPTDRMTDDFLKQVSQRVPVPVMADESLMTLKDVFRLTRRDCTDMINIKIMKVGGITEALHINSVAKAAGVESMIGCMDESALGISAGLHFALARPNVIYADLDGHLDLKNDPFKNLFRLKNGVLYPGRRPGLGVDDTLHL
jgi:L-alanine-DL-glutamate epimerase-like enolase superfamily enzyme